MSDFIHINLLPIEYRVVRKDYSHVLDARVLVSTAVLLVFLGAYFIGQSFFKANLKGKQETIAQVEKEIGANAYVAAKIRDLERFRNEKTSKNKSLKSISVSKKKWVRILEGVNKSLPLNAWIESIRQSEKNDDEIEVRGRTFVFPEVAEYMIEMEKNEYFAKVSLAGIELQKEDNRDSFLFTLNIGVNPNAGLDSFGTPAEEGAAP